MDNPNMVPLWLFIVFLGGLACIGVWVIVFGIRDVRSRKQ